MKSFTLLFSLAFLSCAARPEKKETAAPVTLDFQIKGIALAAPVEEMDNSFVNPILATGANSIAVMPYGFCSSSSPEVRYNQARQWWGEKDTGVRRTIIMAHEAGLSVMMKPHLWLPKGAYTGELEFTTPADLATWQRSYSAYILHFARLADSQKVEIFCLGTELGSMAKASPIFFQQLTDSLRACFHGKITYAANWNDYKDFPIWDKMDYIGVDAYFKLVDDETPKAEELADAWKEYKTELKKLHEKYQKPLMLAEYGYRNSNFAAKEPWTENDGTRNDVAQANCLEAFYRAFAEEPWVSGGYLWKWYPDKEQMLYATDIDFTPQGKAAEKVVAAWYSK